MAKKYMPGMPLWAKTILCVLGIGVVIFLVASLIGCFTGESPIEVFQPDEQIEQEAPSDEITDGTEDDTTGDETTNPEGEEAQTMSFMGSNGKAITLKF